MRACRCRANRAVTDGLRYSIAIISSLGKRVLLCLGLEHASRDLGHKTAGDEAFAMGTEIISEAGNNITLSGSQSLQSGARNLFSGFGPASEFFLAGNDVKLR